MNKKTTVIGMLSTQQQAEQIVIDLQRAGFGTNDISVLFPDQAGSRDFAHEKNTKAPEGAVAGTGAGGIAGATLGLLAGIGALAIPGAGPFIAAGPIMAALSGAAAGAAVGGIAGGLIGMGIPEIEAKQYEGKLRQGGILLSVHVDTNEEKARAKKVLGAAGARDVFATGEAKPPRADASAPRHR
jgi:hypothetical protein